MKVRKLAELPKCLLCITSIAAIDRVKSGSPWHEAELKEIYFTVQYFLRRLSFFGGRSASHLRRSVTQTEAVAERERDEEKVVRPASILSVPK